jgi:hypothetical protein
MSTTRIQFRGDSAANWASANPVLADREMGLETDTKKFKVGNGALSWNSLDYYTEQDAYFLSMSADTIYSGSTNLYDIFITTNQYDLTVAATDETTAITDGATKVTFYAPRAFTLTGLTATLTTSGSTDSVIDVNYNGSSVLSAPLTIPSSNFYSATTTSTSVISQYGRFTVDIDTAGTGAAGLKVILLGYSNLNI